MFFLLGPHCIVLFNKSDTIPLNFIYLKNKQWSLEIMLSHERYCFGEFTLLGSQQDVFLWYKGKRCYSLNPKKNEEEKNAELSVYFL